MTTNNDEWIYSLSTNEGGVISLASGGGLSTARFVLVTTYFSIVF